MPTPPLIEHFAVLKDPRIDRTKQHLLLDIVVIVVIAFCTVLCGAEGWEDMETFGHAKKEWLQERLLLALLWLRVYPALEVLGFFFGLDKTNAEDNLKDVLATLDTMTSFACDRPTKDRPKVRSAQVVTDAAPLWNYDTAPHARSATPPRRA